MRVCIICPVTYPAHKSTRNSCNMRECVSVKLFWQISSLFRLVFCHEYSFFWTDPHLRLLSLNPWVEADVSLSMSICTNRNTTTSYGCLISVPGSCGRGVEFSFSSFYMTARLITKYWNYNQLLLWEIFSTHIWHHIDFSVRTQEWTYNVFQDVLSEGII